MSGIRLVLAVFSCVVVGIFGLLFAVGVIVEATGANHKTSEADNKVVTAPPPAPPPVTVRTELAPVPQAPSTTTTVPQEGRIDMSAPEINGDGGLYQWVLDDAKVRFPDFQEQQATAYLLCQKFNSGESYADVVLYMLHHNPNHFEPRQIGGIMAGAVAGYCPQQQDRINQEIQSLQGGH